MPICPSPIGPAVLRPRQACNGEIVRTRRPVIAHPHVERTVHQKQAASFDGAGTPALNCIGIRGEILGPEVRRVTPDARKTEQESRRFLIETGSITPDSNLKVAPNPGDGPFVARTGFGIEDVVVLFQALDGRTGRIRRRLGQARCDCDGRFPHQVSATEPSEQARKEH